MIAVLVPAHDEELLIGRCLASVARAAAAVEAGGERVCVVVALDRCRDRTGAIARACGVETVVLHDGNVGLARAAAAAHAIARGARWLATTDADSRVPADWLTAQLALDADAFCGVVAVDDWSGYPAWMAHAFEGAGPVRDGHPHVHGANLGVAADAYLRCGGFAPLGCSEDVALVDALVASGARIARRAQPTVLTSARRVARASGGFSDYLQQLEARFAAGADGTVAVPAG